MITVPVRVSASVASVAVGVGATTATIPVGLGAAYTPAGGDPYTGEYEVTPNEETQILQTVYKIMTGNVTVNPIPSNYGRISVSHNIITVY